MAISSIPPFLLLLCLIPANALPAKTVVSELTRLRSESSAGVIHLTDQLLKRIISVPTPRPFSLLIFFDYNRIHSVKPEITLPALRNDISLLASSFLANNPDPKTNTNLFFFDIEYQESELSFRKFGVDSLPHICIVPPSAMDLRKDPIEMDSSAFSRQAESMAEFVEAKTKLQIRPIHHRPVTDSRKRVIFAAAVIVICSLMLMPKISFKKSILVDKNLWMGGAIIVYFLSVGGIMHNIIRQVPMFLGDMNDPDGLVFFYKGTQTQLGAEGYAVGFLYTIVGLLLAFLTHALVLLKNRSDQRSAMAVVLFASVWAVKKVVFLDNWKTGYSIHSYFPRR
ncbi:PREDICTED: probable dolichyl-diphosphooligosaccharide--protein glycosyltransferase subunit 3B [Ipomoea nil]|uniref:probable dolichyl-diphosphooligosaccharide--protein glycosyltransferase subunit 3B n=1 Tax=Ipomoea nil TaxID=35883 RepID=UPI00090194FF|nr:PREDICTED: probable dolichyl-diphosphooligosaccharide--protein glycosyltransferase subunit 3B [Ipomoea nil]XP_019169535.1 PREDICTED: probable dolichyl-diphosphooligosaccharide--protein glycosyltransferase subunit 3B [Ipomoea nil]